MARLRIVCVVGTRPEAIKMAPLIRALRGTDWADVLVVNSGQHRELATNALSVFGIHPDANLDVMTENQSLASLTGRLFQHLEAELTRARPDMVIAQGDTTTVMVVATTCFYLRIPFAHLEAGLRTHNLRDPFPEEFNRVVCGHLATLHFAPTKSACRALRREGVDRDRIAVTGNTVIDALLETPGKAPRRRDSSRRLLLMTAHRRENFGTPLENVFRAVRDILVERSDVELLFPVHPNPNVRGMAETMLGGLAHAQLVEPLAYDQFVGALRAAFLVISDSGGVQEEAPALGKPVLVTRRETERPEAVAAGVAKLVGTEYLAIRGAVESLLDDVGKYARMASGASPYGDGRASARIVDMLEVYFGLSPQRALTDFEAEPNGGDGSEGRPGDETTLCAGGPVREGPRRTPL